MHKIGLRHSLINFFYPIKLEHYKKIIPLMFSFENESFFLNNIHWGIHIYYGHQCFSIVGVYVRINSFIKCINYNMLINIKTFKRIYNLWKFDNICRCLYLRLYQDPQFKCVCQVWVATHFEKITHFENFFESALNLGPNQRTLKIFSKCVKSVHQHYFWCKLLTHFEKKYRRSKTSGLCFHLIDGISKCYNSLLNWE